MTPILRSAFAMVLLASVPAFAAPQTGSQEQDRQRLAQRDRDQEQGPQGKQAPERGGREGENRGREGQGERGGPPPAQSGPNRGPQAEQGRPAQGPQAERARPAQTARDRRAPVEHGPAQFEKRAFQRNFNAPRRYRAAAYRPPPGWQYRRWTYGESLPRPFWAQNFWITNFWVYDLDRPPFGTEWVRFGPDALLVDTTTGEVLEAEYNVFF